MLISSALLVMILAILLGLDWELWVVLAGALALFVIVVGSSYRLGAGGRSASNDQVDSDRRKATSGLELISRHQAGERDFREASLRSALLLHLDLSGVDLSGAKLRGAQLDRTRLAGAILLDADLRGADLQRAKLTGASLAGANLAGANLEYADLYCANLVGATVTDEQLAKAKSLEGAVQPDGTVHESFACGSATSSSFAHGN